MSQQYQYPDHNLAKLSERILTKQDVLNLTGLSKSTIYVYIQLGKFPAPIKIGARRVGWPEYEVRDWIGSKITESRLDSNNSRLLSNIK